MTLVAQEQMDQSGDRRRHTRFDMSSAPSELWLISPGGQNARLEACRLLNLSFGGMCFTASHSLDREKVYPFRIKLTDLDPDPFSVQAEIRWQQQDTGGWVMGAAFRESTKGWVGPEEKG
jgi:hypothetical protein